MPSNKPLDPANPAQRLRLLSLPRADRKPVSLAFVKTANLSSDSFIGVGEVISGQLARPFEEGRQIDFTNGSRISPAQSVVTDASANIILRTAYSVYKLVGAVGAEARASSLAYFVRGYLDFDDRMPDGFFDGGRGSDFFEGPDGCPMVESHRESIILDAAQDGQLAAKAAQIAAAVTSGIPASAPLTVRARLLALAVADKMGGISVNSVPDDVMHARIMSFAERGTYAIARPLPIGRLDMGVCRHRALLFKYCADRLGIPSRVVRGLVPGGGHVWNVVRFEDGSLKVVDVMQAPGEFLDESVVRTKRYARMDALGALCGGGLKSVPVNHLRK